MLIKTASDFYISIFKALNYKKKKKKVILLAYTKWNWFKKFMESFKVPHEL